MMNTIYDYIPESMGKFISERHPEGKFNKQSRMFEHVFPSVKGVMLESYTDYKYFIGATDMPGCFKLAEQDYLYEEFVTKENFIEVSYIVYDEKQCNGIVYHITTKNDLKKIEENGLIPRNKQFLDRVYLFPNLPPDNFEQRCKEFAETRKKKKREILTQAIADYKANKISREKLDYLLKNRYDYRDWAVLKIDLKDPKVYRDGTLATRYRFFDDPKAPSGIFTYENIDPYYIKLPPIAEFKIKDTDDFENLI